MKTKAPVEELWRQYQADRSIENRNRLAEHYQKYVLMLARRTSKVLSRTVEVDDLVQWGQLGLLGAIERFSTDRKIKFETFARRRVLGAMYDGIREFDHITRAGRNKVHKVKLAREAFLQRAGYAPTVEELAEALEMKPAEVMRIDGWAEDIGSLSDADEKAGHRPRHQVLADPRHSDPGADLVVDDLKRSLLGRLDRREQLLFSLYQLEGLSLKVASRACGYCESRGSQLMESIKARLAAWTQGNESSLVGAA